ncbi:MAG: RES domain-containing protein [Gammaproteobacteria bacterium]|nr:MAG: RES domain-containing protein [Gammaproteobacteria bacterium]
MNIWAECEGDKQITQINCSITRVVESQQFAATMSLVDTHDEQELLEQLLEENKPQIDLEQKHYLITTPFRYPPLKYGSRFGERHFQGIFYASADIKTCFCECAYYRFLFMEGMDSFPEAKKINTQHITFWVTINSNNAIKLDKSPFTNYKELISPDNYTHTQKLGSEMRNSGVEAFSFISARDNSGINYGVFEQKAIISSAPYRINHWQCTTSINSVIFYNHIENSSHQFLKDRFIINDILPTPAS